MNTVKKQRCTKIDMTILSKETKQFLDNNALSSINDEQVSINKYIYALYCVVNNNITMLDALQKRTSLFLDWNNGQLLHQAVYHNHREIVDYLLNKQLYSEKNIEKSCVISIKNNNLPMLNKLNVYAVNHYPLFQLSFSKNCCIRIAIKEELLPIIKFLNECGVSPFKNTEGTKVYCANKHLTNLIERDKEEWINYYLEHNILKADHVVNHGRGIFMYMMMFSILGKENYQKGFYYAKKIVDKMIVREDGVKEVKKLYKEIFYKLSPIYNQIEIFRDEVRTQINYKIMNNKLKHKNDNELIKKHKI